MALKARSRSSLCPSPRSALGARPGLRSGQTPKRGTQSQSRHRCQLSPAQSHCQRSRPARFWMRKENYNEVKSPVKPCRRGHSSGFLKAVTPRPGVFAPAAPPPPFTLLHGLHATGVDTGKGL